MNITAAIYAQCRMRPDHPAIENGGRLVSYGLLARMISHAARGLRQRGIEAGDIVIVSLPDTAEHVALLLALAEIGAVSLSLDFRALAADNRKTARGLAIRAAIEAADISHFPETEPVALAALFDGMSGDRHALPAADASRAFDPDTPLMIIQSSGTTGEPKRIIMTHRQMAERNQRSLALLGLTAADRYLQLPHLRFFDGRRRCIKMLMLGGTVVMAGNEMASDSSHVITARKITYAYLTPFHLRALLASATRDEPLWPNLKIVLGMAASNSGERLLARQRLTPFIFDTYGTNEIGTVVISTPTDQIRQPQSIGRLIAGIDAQVIDADDRPLPAGEIGLIGFRGPYFAQSYLDDPSVTARFFRSGWFYPGDLALIDDEGYVFLTGRADDVINHTGAKYFPSEVEAVLSSHPAVAEIAVIGGPHPDYGEVTVAYIVRSAPLSFEDILKYCGSRIAVHKAPYWAFFVTSIPKVPPGKPDKKKLKAQFARYLESQSRK